MNTSIMIVIWALLVVACGKGSGGGGGESATQREEGPLEGKYRVILRPFNTSVSGFLPTGAAEIVVENDALKVKTLMDDGSPVSHVQSIHIGRSCPSLKADANEDGLVDFPEALAIAGPVLIPLDEDISGQDAGKGIYPKGSSFTYQKSARLSDVVLDLKSQDMETNDTIVKLKEKEMLGLEGKVLLIHGTADKGQFPSSVQSGMGLPKHLSFPIACGVIERYQGNLTI